MRKSFFRFASAVLALGVSTGGAVASPPAGEGTAAGTLEVGGTVTPLAHAYARAEKGYFGKEKDVRVILTDVALLESALADPFERRRMAADGKLHGVEVVLDAQKQPIAGVILHEAFRKFQGSVSVTGMHRFEPKVFNAATVEGTLSTERPSEFQGTTFKYSASFRAAVWHPPAPTVKGAAAKATLPAKAALAFFVAVHRGDIAAVKGLMTPESAKPLDGPNGRKMLEFLKTVTPEPARARIESVDIREDTAEVAVSVKTRDTSETSRVRLEKRAGGWKVAM